MAKVTFYGACGCVTGSQTLLEWGDTRILVDCGMYQGGEDLKRRNWEHFPFSPSSLTAVLVTHAHLDHTGLLPKLTKHGFSGPIYCTKASRGLISLILEDAGEIQVEQARYARKKKYSRHKNPQPLYTEKDSKQAISLLRTVGFNEEREVAPGIMVRWHRAGHLLGAGSLEISAKGSDGKRRTWLFSGDVGRYDVPILKDPDPPNIAADALVLESTYGDRRHRQEDSKARLRQIVSETFARGGMVIIPAFALGRSQEVLYYLNDLVDEGLLDERDVFLDSPMAIDATELYERAKAEHDEELAEMVTAKDSPFSKYSFQRCRKVSQSKEINSRKRPAVIVASSGMATAGRVVHHLLRRLDDRRCSVVFTGYQAHGTRGRALLSGADSVSIHGRRVRVKAQIHSLHGLSAHADSEELLRWCQNLPQAPNRLFLNHGEDEQRRALAALLHEEGWPRATLPLSGDHFDW